MRAHRLYPEGPAISGSSPGCDSGTAMTDPDPGWVTHSGARASDACAFPKAAGRRSLALPLWLAAPRRLRWVRGRPAEVCVDAGGSLAGKDSSIASSSSRSASARVSRRGLFDGSFMLESSGEFAGALASTALIASLPDSTRRGKRKLGRPRSERGRRFHTARRPPLDAGGSGAGRQGAPPFAPELEEPTSQRMSALCCTAGKVSAQPSSPKT